jgi:hypothetical protein
MAEPYARKVSFNVKDYRLRSENDEKKKTYTIIIENPDTRLEITNKGY